jgi:hypothetical protein
MRAIPKNPAVQKNKMSSHPKRAAPVAPGKQGKITNARVLLRANDVRGREFHY